MNSSDTLNLPWALHGSQLHGLIDLIGLAARMDSADIARFEVRSGTTTLTLPKPAVTRGGVAVVAVDGFIVPRANVLTRLGLATSAEVLLEQIAQAKADTSVKSLLLTIDSPGGSVQGTPSLADAVRSFGRPTVAAADGMACSAAYWVASAADRIFATEKTAQVGSIGIAAIHEHRPTADGRVKTELTSGRYKRIASSNAPLSAEGHDYLQAQLDHVYGVFLGAVAANRGVSMEKAQSMADGRIFIGQQALDAGLIDGFASIGQLVAQMSGDPASIKRRAAAPGSTTPAASSASTPTFAAAATPPLPPPPSKAAKVELVQAHQAQHGGDFMTVYRQLGLDALHPHEQAFADVAVLQKQHRLGEIQVQIANAHRYAAERKVSFVQAVKALGYTT